MSKNRSINDLLNQETPIQDQIDDLLFLLIRERKKKKITQAELSAKTQIPQPTISRLESFSTIPTLPIVLRLSNALGLTLTLINYGDDNNV